MANENVEGSGAKSMAGSEKYNGGFMKNMALTKFLGGIMGGGDSGGGGNSGGGKRKTGNGWTADDYKNYGDYTERDRYQQGMLNQHSEDMKTVRNNEDLLTDINRQRASKAINGYGRGNQGGSRQQTKPGGRQATSGKGSAIGGKLGAVAGAALGKTPTAAAVGTKVGEKLGDAIESKVINRKPKATATATATAKPKPKATTTRTNATASTAKPKAKAKPKPDVIFPNEPF